MAAIDHVSVRDRPAHGQALHRRSELPCGEACARLRPVGGAGSERLLEREFELGVVHDAVAAAAHDLGRLVVVEGPAGIGKTRLLDEPRERAPEAGLLLLSARSDPSERDAPFGAVRALLASAATTREDLAELFTGPASLCMAILSGAVHTHDEGALLYALDWFVTQLVEDEPVAIVLDDAQWADPGSQRWLTRVSASAMKLGFLLAIGVRVGPRGSYSGQLAGIAARDEALVIRPRPLTRTAVIEVLRDELEAEPEPGFAEACHEATGGNPFYARELARTVKAERLEPLARHARQVRQLRPDRLARSVLVRIGALAAPAPDVARAVAVLGTGAQLRHIAALTGATPSDVARALDLLAEEEFLHEGHPTEYLHPLLRDIVWDSIPRRRRAAAHALAAELLADDGAPETRVAAHLLDCDPMGNAWVVQALLEAARRETGSETAVAYLRRALAEPPPPNLREDVQRELRVTETSAQSWGSVVELSRVRGS